MELSLTRIMENAMAGLIVVSIGGLIVAGLWLYIDINTLRGEIDDAQTSLDDKQRAISTGVTEMMTEVESRVAKMMEDVIKAGRSASVDQYDSWLGGARLEYCKESVRDSDVNEACTLVLGELEKGRSLAFHDRLGRGEQRRLRENWLFSEFYDLMAEPVGAMF